MIIRLFLYSSLRVCNYKSYPAFQLALSPLPVIGWSDNYGCEDGTIYNFSGRTCLYRGSAYVFAWLGVIFSLGVGVAHCFIMRNDYLNKGEEIF